MTASASRRSRASTRTTSRASSSPTRCRSAAASATTSTRRRRWSRTASSTSRIPGASSTRSTSRSGNVGRIVWRMDPKQERQEANRGVALWGNFVISIANQPARVIATDKESGKVVWETNVSDIRRCAITGAPLAIKDKILMGAAGERLRHSRLARRARRQDRQAALAQVHDPGAGRARQRDLEGQEQRLADRRRADLGHRHLRSADQPDHLGHRQSGAGIRSDLSAGRQSLHQQRDLLQPRHRQA